MKIKYGILLAVFLLFISGVLSACSFQQDALQDEPWAKPEAVKLVKVHFIDVGQADCSFIQLADGKTVLIDGGNKADAELVISYLKQLNITTIDYLIATHPHEDHIGALPAVIREFNVGSIYMPKAATTTRIFEDLLLAIKEKGYKINTAAAGVKIIDGPELKLIFLAPNSSKYEELNNYSAVVKLTYLSSSFLFTGDAEDISEKEILSSNADVNANLLKIGHHGGRTSTTKQFLEAVSPEFAVISVGKDNDYGHPHSETMDRLKAMNVKILRTDQQGSIIVESDGSKITIDKTPIAVPEQKPASLELFIGNKNSKVFHLSSCSSLPKPDNQIIFNSREEAQARDYKPCQTCKP